MPKQSAQKSAIHAAAAARLAQSAAQTAIRKSNNVMRKFDRQQHPSAVAGAMANQSNLYLAALVDPEHSGHNMGIPDEFYADTYRYTSITEFELTPTGADPETVGFDGGGQANVIMTNDLKAHVFKAAPVPPGSLMLGTWEERQGGILQRCDNVSNSTNIANRSASSALVPSRIACAPVFDFDFAFTEGFAIPSGFLTDQQTNLALNAQYRLGYCANANGNYGIPVRASRNPHVVARVQLTNSVNGNNLSMTVHGFLGAAPVISVGFVGLTADPGWYICDADCSGMDRVNNVCLTAGVNIIADKVVCSMYHNGTTPVWTVAEIGTGAGAPQSGSSLQALPVPDYPEFATGVVQKYRLVSASVWLQNDASDLHNGGRMVGALITEREEPINRRRQYVEIDDITKLRSDSTCSVYDGQLKHGCFAIWKPESEADFRWRSFDELCDFSNPYITLVANNATDTSGQQLRARIVANWEMITLSNTLPRLPSVCDSRLITQVFTLLQGFPCIQANDEHESKTAKFFRILGDATSGMKKVFGTVVTDTANAINAFGGGDTQVGSLFNKGAKFAKAIGYDRAAEDAAYDKNMSWARPSMSFR